MHLNPSSSQYSFLLTALKTLGQLNESNSTQQQKNLVHRFKAEALIKIPGADSAEEAINSLDQVCDELFSLFLELNI